MAGEEDAIREIRRELINLIQTDDWEFNDKSRADGLVWLQRSTSFPTEVKLIEYVLSLLQADFPMQEVGMGEPPGSLGTGYTMNNTDGQGLYIKLTIERGRARVVSFHVSKHYKGS
jgi:hypothetical protein